MALKIKKTDKVATPARDDIDSFITDMNKRMKGVGRVDRGRDISYPDPPRLRTGILGLDVLSNGGYPRGGIVQQWGPWSSSKTTSLLKMMAEEQRKGNNVAFAAGEGFNKPWARRAGLYIPYGQLEYAAASGDGELVEQMKEYDRYGKLNRVGSLSVFQHMHGDGLLELSYQAVRRNIFSIVGVDSLAILKNTRQIEEAEVGDEERGSGGQIQMFNRFMAKNFSALNTRYNAKTGEPDMNGEVPNKTCLVCINQARMNQNAHGRKGGGSDMQPLGGEGLKHSWHLSIRFTRGEEYGEEVMVDGKKKWGHWAVAINAKCQKSKIGPEGRVATWDLYVDAHKEFGKGDVDRAKEARIWGEVYKCVERKGNSLEYNGVKGAGKDSFVEALRNEPELLEQLEDEIIERCRQ